MDKKTTLMLVTLGLALSSVPVYADTTTPAPATPTAPQSGSQTGEKHPNMMHEDRHKMEEDRQRMMEERRKMEEERRRMREMKEREMRERRGHEQRGQQHGGMQGGQQHGNQPAGTTTTTPAPAAAN